jgi:hypothetical protein
MVCGSLGLPTRRLWAYSRFAPKLSNKVETMNKDKQELKRLENIIEPLSPLKKRKLEAIRNERDARRRAAEVHAPATRTPST